MDYSRFFGSSSWGAWSARGAAAAGLTSEYDPGWAGNGVLPFEAEAAQKAREAAARGMRKNAFIEGQPDQERLDALNASAPEMMTPAVMSAPAIAPADAAATSPPPMQDAGPDSAPAVSPSVTPPWLGMLNGAPLDYSRPSPPSPTVGAYAQADQTDVPPAPSSGPIPPTSLLGRIGGEIDSFLKKQPADPDGLWRWHGRFAKPRAGAPARHDKALALAQRAADGARLAAVPQAGPVAVAKFSQH